MEGALFLVSSQCFSSWIQGHFFPYRFRGLMFRGLMFRRLMFNGFHIKCESANPFCDPNWDEGPAELDLMCSGFWCPPGQRQAMAFPCPRGHYCPQGSAAPQPCPSGNYQDLEKQAGCKVCQAGRSYRSEAYLEFITLFYSVWSHLFSTE